MKAYKITGKLGDICSFVGGQEVKKGDMVYFYSESDMKQECVAKPQGNEHMIIEAMKQALEALECIFASTHPYRGDESTFTDEASVLGDKAITSLRQAIEQAEKQDVELCSTESKETFDQPVAWIYKPHRELLWPNEVECTTPIEKNEYEPLYTQPVREWVGLTDAEIEEFDYYARDLVMDIEKALKEKNNVA